MHAVPKRLTELWPICFACSPPGRTPFTLNPVNTIGLYTQSLIYHIRSPIRPKA